MTRRGFAPIFIIVIVAIAAVLGGWYYVKKSSGPAPSGVEGPQPAVVTTTTSIYSISNLGLLVYLPSSLSDLTHNVVHLAGDQAVNSVEFSTIRLESAGCPLSSAPLGYLTYDNDKGGVVVAHARGSDLYYIKPTVQCGAALQDWPTLQQALKTIVSNFCGGKEAVQCPSGSMCQPDGYYLTEGTCVKKTDSADTSNLKTYRNEKYGFEIKYPPNLSVSLDPEDSYYVGFQRKDANKNGELSTPLSLEVLELNGRKMEDLYTPPNNSQRRLDFKTECKTIIIAGTSAYDCLPSVSFAGEEVIVFSHGNLAFEITSYGKNNQILSTFKFTKN